MGLAEEAARRALRAKIDEKSMADE